MKTNVYIDGYNLYYGCLKGTPFRWLNIRKFCESMVQAPNTLGRIRYFTARVNVQPPMGDGTQVRQQIYLRALETLGIDIHYGRYQAKPTKAMQHPLTNPPSWVRILKTEEKGSDVNLASHLILDGVRKDYERAIVVSNDSDLVTPVQMVRDDLHLPVGICFPCTNADRTRSFHLPQVASFHFDVRRSMLKTSQLPDEMRDDTGKFSRPVRWR